VSIEDSVETENAELARLDLVSESKLPVNRITDGELSARAAGRELSDLQARRDPYPAWLRCFGVVLFAAGFAPSVQATWRELGSSLVLGALAGIVFVGGERAGRLRLLLPLVGRSLSRLSPLRFLTHTTPPEGPWC